MESVYSETGLSSDRSCLITVWLKCMENFRLQYGAFWHDAHRHCFWTCPLRSMLCNGFITYRSKLEKLKENVVLYFNVNMQTQVCDVWISYGPDTTGSTAHLYKSCETGPHPTRCLICLDSSDEWWGDNGKGSKNNFPFALSSSSPPLPSIRLCSN